MRSASTVTDMAIHTLEYLSVDNVLLVVDAVDVPMVSVRSLCTSISCLGVMGKVTTWETGRGERKLKFTDTVRSSVSVI